MSVPAGSRSPLAKLTSLTRARSLSCQELVRFTAEHIAALNEPLNAVTTLDPERALERAAGMDGHAARGGHVGPLWGLPVLVKETENVAGLATTYGSLTTKDQPAASFTDNVPARLEAAGAIILGKTNTPEHAFEVYTSNPLFGATRNPWAKGWSPGGSSGGAAAALAAGMVPIATGTDGGGSVRIPGALCGLLGLKPTRGALPRWPTHPWMDLSTSGILGLTTADVALLLGLERGDVAGDMWSGTSIARPATTPLQVDRVVGLDRFVDWGPLPTDVGRQFEEQLGRLGSLLEVDVERPARAPFSPAAANPDDDWFTMATAEQMQWLGADFVDAHADEFDPVFLGYLDRGRSCPVERYVAARRNSYQYTRELDQLLADRTLLVTPTVTATGFSPDGREDGRSRPGVAPSAVNTVLQNMTGHPAASLPAGSLPNGCRFGLQLTGPRGSDQTLLGLAAEWERWYPWELAATGYATFLGALGSGAT